MPADAKKKWKITQNAKGYKCKEGFDAHAISAIWQRAVKCSSEMATLLRITLALFLVTNAIST